MTSVQSPSPTEASSVIRVAIICEPETTVLADSLETLLERAKGITFSRFDYRAESDLNPRAAGVANPDVVVATLDSFQATKVQPLLAPLQRAFPNRPLLVTTRDDVCNPAVANRSMPTQDQVAIGRFWRQVSESD